MFYVLVYDWRDGYGWCAGESKIKHKYKRYMGALTAIHNEINKLNLGGSKTWQYTDTDGNFKVNVETEKRLYIIEK